MKSDSLHEWADKWDRKGRRAHLGKVQWRLFYNSKYEFCLTTGKLDTTCMYTKITRKCLSKKIQVLAYKIIHLGLLEYDTDCPKRPVNPDQITSGKQCELQIKRIWVSSNSPNKWPVDSSYVLTVIFHGVQRD